MERYCKMTKKKNEESSIRPLQDAVIQSKHFGKIELYKSFIKGRHVRVSLHNLDITSTAKIVHRAFQDSKKLPRITSLMTQQHFLYGGHILIYIFLIISLTLLLVAISVSFLCCQ